MYLIYIYETLSLGTLYTKDHLDLQNKNGKMRNEKAKAKKHWLWKRKREYSLYI